MKRSAFLLLDYHPDLGETHSANLVFLLEHAQLADSLGFDALWLAEHHFQRLGSAPNPAVVLAAVAAQTKRLRIGPSVSILPYRSPVLVAEDYAMVDLLSQGRLNMGVGCGSQEIEFSGLNIDFENRRDVFDRNLAGLRDLWSEGRLNITPHQSRPPVYVATTTAETARAIGQRGDSVITLLGPGTEKLDDVETLLDAHNQGLHEGGYAPNDAEVVVTQIAHVASSDSQARQQAIPALNRLLSVLAPNSGRADTESMYLAMQSGATGCFGSAENAVETISRLENIGVRHTAFITRFGGLSANAAHDSLRLLAPAA